MQNDLLSQRPDIEHGASSQAFAIVNNSAARTCVHLSSSSSLIVSSLWIPRNGITKSNGRNVFKVIDACCQVAFLKAQQTHVFADLVRHCTVAQEW